MIRIPVAALEKFAKEAMQSGGRGLAAMLVKPSLTRGRPAPTKACSRAEPKTTQCQEGKGLLLLGKIIAPARRVNGKRARPDRRPFRLNLRF